MFPYKLPLKFILLWVINIALLLVIALTTGIHDFLLKLSLRNLAWVYLAAGAVLAALEQSLFDKLRGK